MASRIEVVSARPSFRLADIRRYKNTLMTLLLALCVLAATVYLTRPAAVVNLGLGNPSGLAQLRADWAAGEMIVLVRHVERCDHSSAACLSGNDGITDRSRSVAVSVGAQFEQLGLDNADIYNSPMTRTAQTAGFMFNKVSANDDWLVSCRGTMLRDALAHKVPGRNLVLVTHSECMSQMEKDLKLPATSLGYGASLFVSAQALQAPRMLGFIEASDWRSVAFQ